MNNTITFEVKNVEWSGMFEGRKTSSCLVNVRYEDVARCVTDEEVAALVLKTLELDMGCLVKVCDSIRVAD